MQKIYWMKPCEKISIPLCCLAQNTFKCDWIKQLATLANIPTLGPWVSWWTQTVQTQNVGTDMPIQVNIPAAPLTLEYWTHLILEYWTHLTFEYSTHLTLEYSTHLTLEHSTHLTPMFYGTRRRLSNMAFIRNQTYCIVASPYPEVDSRVKSRIKNPTAHTYIYLFFPLSNKRQRYLGPCQTSPATRTQLAAC